MRIPTTLFAACLVLAPGWASAQPAKSDPPPADFKGFVQPLLPPIVLPPSSSITPGAITGDPITPYSTTPGYDAARSAPAPGLRLTIPTR